MMGKIGKRNRWRAISQWNAYDWVQIGPFVAKKIEREKNVVLATFDIPASATQGVFYDCHIEFGREAYPISIKRNDALRVVE
jgi:hypothetical protein